MTNQNKKRQVLQKLKQLSDGDKKSVKSRYFSDLARQHSLYFAPIVALNRYDAAIEFLKKDTIHIDKIEEEICERSPEEKTSLDPIMNIINEILENLSECEYDSEKHDGLMY